MYQNKSITLKQLKEDWKLLEHIFHQHKLNPINKSPKFQQQRERLSPLYDTTIRSAIENCDDVYEYYGQKYHKDTTNEKALNDYYNALEKKHCKNEDSYFPILLAINEIQPDAKKQREIARHYYRNSQWQKAEYYFLQSISPELNEEKKALTYLLLARMNRTRLKNTTTCSAYLDSIYLLNATKGNAYHERGLLYILLSENCSSTFDKQMAYLAATRLWHKALKHNCSNENEVRELIASYASHLPKKSDYFIRNLTPGQDYYIPCLKTSIPIPN